MTRPRNIGVLGGTFNPIHIGHLIMAENALCQLGLDLVVFAPAGDPPHKADDGLVDAEQRLRLVESAIADRPGFLASRIDMEDDGPSYTWSLLERCHGTWPGVAFHFIVGGDSLCDFSGWARPQRILKLARIAVIARPGYPALEDSVESVPGLRDRLDIVETPMCSISSTEVRARIATGRSIRYLVPESVRQAIAREGLYASTDR